MTQGLSGTFAFNGTELTLPPTEGAWQERESYGFDGNAHLIYSAVRSYKLTWNLMSASDLSQIIGFYDTVQNTGSFSVDLPQWGASDYRFLTYSGATLQEPIVSENFAEHTQDVSMLIFNIRT